MAGGDSGEAFRRDSHLEEKDLEKDTGRPAS